MTDPRIALLSSEEATRAAEQAGVPSIYAPLSVFRVLLHHPRLAKAMHDLLAVLLFDARLDQRLRELVIMRIGWVTRSNYEWTQHWRVARGLQVPEDDLVAVRDWLRSDRFGPVERAVLQATDETLDTGTVSAHTWQSLNAHIADRQAILELVVAIGHWRMFSSLLRSLEIPLEEGVRDWPPDGTPPA